MDDDRTGDQVSNVGNDLKAGTARAAETVTDLAAKAQAAAVEAGQLGDAAAKIHKQSAQAAEYVSRNTAEQPFLALLIAAAVGYGIAYIIYGH